MSLVEKTLCRYEHSLSYVGAIALMGLHPSDYLGLFLVLALPLIINKLDNNTHQTMLHIGYLLGAYGLTLHSISLQFITVTLGLLFVYTSVHNPKTQEVLA